MRSRPMRRKLRGLTFVTLRAGAGVSRRLVGAGIVAASVARALVWVWLGMVLAKISASLRKAESYFSPIRANDVLGWGSLIANAKSLAVSMAASAEDVVGIK